MKTNFKTKQKQLKQLLGDDFNNIYISLIQISKVKDEYHNVGDIISNNEYPLNYTLERLIDGYDYIGGWEIPFTDYEMSLGCWFGDDGERIPSNWYKVEKQISEILGLKIHQFKTELVDVDDDLPF